MFGALLTTLLLCGAAQTASSPSDGRGRERVLVVPLDESARDLAPLYDLLEEERVGVVTPLERSGVDLPLSPHLHRTKNLDDVRSSFLEARRALMSLEVNAAEVALHETRTRLLQLARPTDHLELFADVLLARAELLLARGDDSDADRELRLLARLDPQRTTLHPGLHAPALVAHYEAARRKNIGEERGRLRLARAASAPWPEVWLDGAVADARLDNDDNLVELSVGTGPHLVSLLAPGCVPKHFIVEVNAARELALILDTSLVPLGADEARLAALQRYRGSPAEHESLQTLLSLANADVALVVTSSGSRLWPSRGEGTVLPAYQPETAPALARAVAAVLVHDDEDPQVVAGADTGAPQRWWWAGAATAAALLVLGGASLAGVLWLGVTSDTTIDPPPRPVVVTGFGAGR